MPSLYLNGRRVHFTASRFVTGSNDRTHCARCGRQNCGCSDHQWNGSPPVGVA